MNPDTCPNYFNGYKIITSLSMTELDGYDEIKRSWKERLFTRPWKPRRKYKHKVRYKPSRQVIFDDKHMFMYVHPAMLKEIKRAIDKNNENRNSNNINGSYNNFH